jgi:hypothetical protein
VSGMALLPQELSGSNERSRVLELPTHDISPLVKAKGQISVRVNPLGIAGIHDSLTSRSYSDRFLEISFA